MFFISCPILINSARGLHRLHNQDVQPFVSGWFFNIFAEFESLSLKNGKILTLSNSL